MTDLYDALTPPPPLSSLLIFKGLIFICSTYLYGYGNPSGTDRSVIRMNIFKDMELYMYHIYLQLKIVARM